MQLYFIILLIFSFKSVHASSNAPNCNGIFTSITTYDLKSNKWNYTHKKDAKTGTLPASTFKITNSLISLDLGVTDTNEVFKWDKVKRSLPQWNQDMSLKMAFELSGIWVHELLAQRITAKNYKRYLKWMNYGNSKINNGKNGNFWVYGDFKVTPIEQINMLKSLYNNELPFSKNTMETVKSFMQNKDKPNIYAKTGLLDNYNGERIGWWVGWIIKDQSPLFYATRLRQAASNPTEDFAVCRQHLTLKFMNGLAN